MLKSSVLVVAMRAMACAAIISGAGFGDGIHRAITIPKCALGLFLSLGDGGFAGPTSGLIPLSCAGMKDTPEGV
jgi:hypothetical protein